MNIKVEAVNRTTQEQNFLVIGEITTLLTGCYDLVIAIEILEENFDNGNFWVGNGGSHIFVKNNQNERLIIITEL